MSDRAFAVAYAAEAREAILHVPVKRDAREFAVVANVYSGVELRGDDAFDAGQRAPTELRRVHVSPGVRGHEHPERVAPGQAAAVRHHDPIRHRSAPRLR